MVSMQPEGIIMLDAALRSGSRSPGPPETERTLQGLGFRV